MPTLDLDIALVGGADGVPVELSGRGSVDTEVGRLALAVRSLRRPLLFDPAVVALSLLDVLALAATWPDTPDAHVHVRSRTDLYDEHGREAGGWRIVAALGRTGGGVRFDGQLLDHVVRIEPGERVVAVDAAWATLVQTLEPEGVLLAGAWDARTGRGNGYRAATTTLVDGWVDSSARPAVVKIAFDAAKIRRSKGQATGETVAVEAAFSVDLLTPPPR